MVSFVSSAYVRRGVSLVSCMSGLAYDKFSFLVVVNVIRFL